MVIDTDTGKKMTIETKKVVSLKYELRINAENGEMVEKVENDRPLQFIYGVGSMLEKFELNINGLAEGESFKFKLKADEAYGNINPEMVVDVPKEIFKVDGKLDESLLVIDKVIPMRDQQGNHLNGKVVEIKDEQVTLDFNHPLAGEDLYFAGEVLNIRDASEEELSHGHIHDDSHGCGCGSGCGCH
ncbi:MAG: FKBP-type peptidyl-prolyl cis-trans isomerase [Bacteroidales bacterium]|nr:FKBP-type peptidyl-prolyl cis-trans isomerase [Bacteroidales bacterium]